MKIRVNYPKMYTLRDEIFYMANVGMAINNLKCMEVLHLLEIHNILSISDIARLLNYNQGSVSRIVDKLYTAKLVTKSKAKGNKYMITLDINTKQNIHRFLSETFIKSLF